MNSRESIRSSRVRWFALLALLPGTAVGQTAASSPAEANPPASNVRPVTAPAEETVVLSPFQVDATRDSGFVAASALAGGRLSTDLKDTPVAYSVLTRDFIDAVNVKDLTDAGKWVPSANVIDDDNRQTQFGSGNQGRRTFRGVTGNTQMLEFFPAYYDYDSYNIERFDFGRGPNSILFGEGSMGGTANALVKRARTDKALRETRLQIGSWNNYRVSVDVNQPVSDRLAVRVNGLWQDAESWRDREWSDRLAGAIAVTFVPWERAQLRISGETGSYSIALGVAGWGDGFTGWDGTTTFSAPLASVPTNATATGINRVGSPTAPYFLVTPSLGSTSILNWANSAQTRGGHEGGSPIGGRTVVGGATGYNGAPVNFRLNSPANVFGPALAGSSLFIPDPSNSPKHDDETQSQDFDNINVSLDQQFGPHFYAGVAANHTITHVNTDYTVVRGLGDQFRVDINRNLPSGQSNPNFLRAYTEATRDYDYLRFRAKGWRAFAAAVFDDTRFGDFRANAEIGSRRDINIRNKYRYSLQDPAIQAQDWLFSSQHVRYRYYLNDAARPLPNLGPSATVVDPIAGTTRTVPVGWTLDNQADAGFGNFDYMQASLQARFFKERVNVLAAVRRDDYESGLSQRTLRGSLPTNWDGKQVIHNPRAPADWFDLTYVPKDANGNPTGAAVPAITRPRDGQGRPLPQYANDRFQNDYSPPIVADVLNTYSYGTVVHLTPWISAFGNYAETFNPPALDRRITGEVFPALLSDGIDYGLRFNLLQGRFVASVARYEAEQQNVRLGTGTGTGGIGIPLEGAFNGIILANVVGDQSPGGQNIRGMTIVPNNYADTANRKTSGYEIEITANLTAAWRMLANFSTAKATQGDGYAETRAYLAANEATFRQILADAGVLIDASGQATVNQSIPINQRSPDADNAANSWNTLQVAKGNLTPVDQKVSRLNEATANFFTDYTFLEGPLKNLRIGAGFNYRGKEVIGFRGADTIVSPTNPTQAIDDPSVDATTPVYRDPYTVALAAVGYSFRLMNKYPIRLDLTVNNLLDEDAPLYYEVRMYAPNGDVSSPARVATPARYGLLTPRSYTLSATVSF